MMGFARGVWLVLLGIGMVVQVAAAEPVKFAFQPGDHVSLIGNTMADRLQHDGLFEAVFQTHFREQKLSFRNLGFSGDELNMRLRSQDFGSPDQWLTRTQTDVVLAFFGYNESWKGEAGLDGFRGELDGFVKHTLGQKYNGESAPRLVLITPAKVADQYDHPVFGTRQATAIEVARNAEINARIAAYSKVMVEVGAANGVPVVDLSGTTMPATINGLHSVGTSHQWLAAEIIGALFPALDAAKNPGKPLDSKLVEAIQDKDFHWFNRYRVTDGFSVFGGRSGLVFEPEKQTNLVVAQREMAILDQMTGYRDDRIWSIAQGKGDIKVDDSKTEPFIPVISNKPGPGPNGEHIFLDGGDEAISKMTMHPGMEIKLFASEKQFPELVNPVQMATDMKGRVWVACWPMYTHWRPKDPVNDSLLILEDTNGDGTADKCITFAGDLHNPTGFEFYAGGVLVANTPDLLFLKDTDGDDKADVRIRVLNGLDSADTHHAANSFSFDPGGALYFQEGTFHQSQVESTWGPPARCSNGGVFRYEPLTQKFSVYVTHGFANPHGHVWDRWGNDIVHDGTGSQPYPGWLFSGHMNYPQKHATPPQIYQQRTRPTSGTEILSSEHFPPDVQGNLLVANVIGFQGILQYQLREDGGTIVGTEVEPIVTSTDPNFRPTDLEIAGDGALYFSDWQNPIIGHMQHNLRDPNRDRTHGRVYRVTATGRPLLKSENLSQKSVSELVKLLASPYDRVRYRAKLELSGRPSREVVNAVMEWTRPMGTGTPDYEHHLMEALWVHQYHDIVNVDLLKRMLASKDHQARAAAGRVLCYWRDRVPETLDLLRTAAADPHPRVRAEAVRTASFLEVPEAVEVVVVAREQLPQDRAVEYIANETMKTLEPIWKSAIDAKAPIAMKTPAGARYLFRTMSTDELIKLEGELAHSEPGEATNARYRMVAQDLLLRTGVRDELRESVLRSLAAANKVSASELLVQQLLGLDATSSGSETIAFDLLRVLTRLSEEEQKQAGPLLVKMATESKQPITRQLGYVAKIAADGSVEPSWELASKSARSLRDLVNAMPMVRDPSVRAALYPMVEPLLDGLPEGLRSGNANTKGSFGRYVRVELQGRRPLTLAEVEVYSDGTNVARRGKATQSTTSHGGEPQRAIDGNTNPIYAAGGQTHTPEDGLDPWWEVDLGAEYPVERITIFNRTEGFENRLDGFTLKVLDANREEVQVLRGLPGPRPKSDFDMSAGNPELLIRRSAMLALTTVRGQEANTFRLLVKFALEGSDRSVAIDAIQRLPKSEWASDQAQPLLDSVIAYLAPLPPAERTSPAALSAIQFGYELTSLLPADQGKAMRAKLGEIGVRIIRIGTVPDQMLYDKERLVVQAGKPVEFLFENTDIMPHNFVIIQPGALEEVGLAAEAQATQPGALERHYVPTSNKVLLASTLLQPRNVQKLSFNVPKEPGVYPYVCTYPGHWRRMFGALYVVADLDAYEADPEGYLAKNAVAAQDTLLKFNRPRKAWTIEELTPLLDEVAHGGRNFGNGKQIFAATNCIACHKLNGVGQEVGQDLAKLDAKQKPADILKSILEPSANINEKFQSYIIETKEGKVHTGLIVEETGEAIKILENPLAKTAAVTIEKSNIETRTKSPTSIMPKGLLDKLTREEILDLLAYVIARGDQKNAVFGAAHDHDHHHDH